MCEITLLKAPYLDWLSLVDGPRPQCLLFYSEIPSAHSNLTHFLSTKYPAVSHNTHPLPFSFGHVTEDLDS